MIACGTQIPFCDLPIRIDTYKGCSHNCKYCFVQRKTNIKNIKVDNPQGIINCKRANNTYLIPGMTYYNPIEIVGIGDFHNSHNRVQDWIKYTR